MKRVWSIAGLGLTAAVLATAIAGPPVLSAPPVSVEARVQKDFLYRPGSLSARQSATRLTSAAGFDYTGPIGPERPLDVGLLEVQTGQYQISYSLPARFAGLTSDPLVCSLVESRSGIPLEPAQSVTFESGAPWTVVQADMPISLPEMTIALRCSTAEETIGRLEVGESSLVATRVA